MKALFFLSGVGIDISEAFQLCHSNSSSSKRSSIPLQQIDKEPIIFNLKCDFIEQRIILMFTKHNYSVIVEGSK